MNEEVRMNIAVKVAIDKEKHPEKYCPVQKCLWRTGDGTYCPRHKHLAKEDKEKSNER